MGFFSFIEIHAAISAIAAYWMFSAFVGGMPAPDDSSSKTYVWIHDSLHILAGNLKAYAVTKYPSLPSANLPQGSTQTQETKTITTVPPAVGASK